MVLCTYSDLLVARGDVSIYVLGADFAALGLLRHHSSLYGTVYLFGSSRRPRRRVHICAGSGLCRFGASETSFVFVWYCVPIRIFASPAATRPYMCWERALPRAAKPAPSTKNLANCRRQ